MLNTGFPRFKGDIGNKETFDFPTYHYVVKEANSMNVVVDRDDKLIPGFVRAARILEDMGIGAITTSCGFLAIYQDILSKSVHVPVATSSLLLLPAISKMSGGRKIGVLTAKKASLQRQHFSACGAENVPVIVEGMEGTEFYHMYVDGNTGANISVMEDELLWGAKKILDTDPSIGAFLLECTNMPPFSNKIKDLGLPVFDIRDLVKLMYHCIV